jgi:hypothetical protein
MIDGRRADSARGRQRVIKALNSARTQGHEISVAAIARMASTGACSIGIRTYLTRFIPPRPHPLVPIPRYG